MTSLVYQPAIDQVCRALPAEKSSLLMSAALINLSSLEVILCVNPPSSEEWVYLQ